MVLIAALGWMSMLNAALLATGGMLATGCMSTGAAGRSIEYGTAAVLACAVGLEAAIGASGLAAVIADLLTGIAGDSAYVALIVVFVGSVVLTNLITNAAAAALMFPIALSIATALGVSFMPFVIAMMMGTSYAFLNPAGYQTNLMVYEPGGYTFGDFGRLGLPLTVLVGAVVLLLTPIFYPFYP
jgi:di/tricarboxylate transporter